MKILGIDSSAKSASVAITDEKKVISHFYINTGLTHSQTLMPMLENALALAGLSLNDINLFAVNKGPGSFTGVRIGVSAIKGIADIVKKPCVGVSTLESMVYNVTESDCVICCVMDARCNQVYNAIFDVSEGKINRLTEDSAISIDELETFLNKYKKNIILVGDGADLCYTKLSDKIKNLTINPDNNKYQNAVGTCYCALNHENEKISSSELIPEYLRLSQAERELNNKLKK